jgi:type II secretory pathway component PulF
MTTLFSWQGYYNNQPIMLHQYACNPKQLHQNNTKMGITKLTVHPFPTKSWWLYFKPDPSIELFQHLERLLKAKFLLPHSLHLIMQQTSCPWRRGHAWLILSHLKQGRLMSDALMQLPEYSTITCLLVRISQNNWHLAQMLALNNQRNKQIRCMQQSVQQAFMYPCFILLTALIMAFILMSQIVPNMVAYTHLTPKKMPALTRHLIDCSWTLNHYGGIILIGLMALGLITQNNAYRNQPWHLILWRCPIKTIKNLIHMHYLIPWGLALAHLLEAHLSITQALSLCQKMLPITKMQQESGQLIAKIKQGECCIESLHHCDFFPTSWLAWVALGQQTNAMPERLKECVHDSWTEYQHQLNNATKMIEPILLLGLGLILAGILIAIYLPMINMAMYH